MANYNFFSDSKDPLLDPSYMDSQIEKMIELRDQMRNRGSRQTQNQQQEAPPEKTVWDEITEELESMSDAQKQMLFADEDYQRADQRIAEIAAGYQMSVLMPYVLGDAEGRKALQVQLSTIRAKKDAIIAREREEYAEFENWKRSRMNNRNNQE